MYSGGIHAAGAGASAMSYIAIPDFDVHPRSYRLRAPLGTWLRYARAGTLKSIKSAAPRDMWSGRRGIGVKAPFGGRW
jgi:hypothetical protein